MNTKRTVVATTVAFLLIGGGTAAFAYWSTSGSGTGSAATSAGAANLLVTQTAAPTNLAPGVAAGGISVDVKNQAANDVVVNQVVVSIASVTGGAGACSAADYTLTNPVMTNGAGALAAGATVAFSGATLGFNNDPLNSQDGCKGASVNLAYAVS
jgi:hypothetical protein